MSGELAYSTQTDNTISLQLNRIANICVPFKSHFSTALFFLSMVVVIYLGWQLRDEEYLTAESGFGYLLGIIGGSLMLLLLLYPLRKKWRPMRNFGPIKWWFRTHMIFGVIGPVAVMYHSNFQLGSLNSNVALICMLLVAASGLIGRYIYSKLHYGLYGQKATLQQLKKDAALTKVLISSCVSANPKLGEQLQSLERAALAQPRGIIHSFIKVLMFAVRTRKQRIILNHNLKKAIKVLAAQQGWEKRKRQARYRIAKKDSFNYLSLIRKIGHLSLYERMFSLWHVLHFPLFLMMVISGIVHVVAVHLY